MPLTPPRRKFDFNDDGRGTATAAVSIGRRNSLTVAVVAVMRLIGLRKIYEGENFLTVKYCSSEKFAYNYLSRQS